MHFLTCPHCLKDDAPYGAKVCRGCYAQIEYGSPSFALALAIALPLFAAWHAGAYADHTLGTGLPVMAATGIPLLVISLYACKRLFAKRVIFRRRYR